MISRSKSASPEPLGPGATSAPSDWARTRQRWFLGCGLLSLVCLTSGPVTGELTQAHPVLAGGHTFWSLVLLVVLAALHGRGRSRSTARSFEVRVCSAIGALQLLLGIGVNLI